MFKKFFVAGLLVVGLAISGSVLAQTDSGLPITTDTVANQTGTMVADDAPQTVPNAWNLFWKEVRERAVLAFTFDPINKAEKAVLFATERIKLAEALTLNAGGDVKLQDRAEKMVERANVLLQNVLDKKDKILQKADERSQQILEKAGEQIIQKEKIIDNLEERLGVERLEKLQQLRQQGLENGQKLFENVSNSGIPLEVVDNLRVVKEEINSRLENTRMFLTEKKELLQRIQNGDEDAKNELRTWQQERKGNAEALKTETRTSTQNMPEMPPRDIQVIAPAHQADSVEPLRTPSPLPTTPRNANNDQIETDACNDIYSPVCSTDGVTYGNKCFAERQGVKIEYAGVCRRAESPAGNGTGSNSQPNAGDLPISNTPAPIVPPTTIVEPSAPAPDYYEDDTEEPEETEEPEAVTEETEEVVRTPSFSINLTQDGNRYTVQGVIDYYGKGGNCAGPRPNDPVIVRWGDGADEPAVNNMTFSSSHEYHIQNRQYTLSVSVYNSCYQMKTEERVITFKL